MIDRRNSRNVDGLHDVARAAADRWRASTHGAALYSPTANRRLRRLEEWRCAVSLAGACATAGAASDAVSASSTAQRRRRRDRHHFRLLAGQLQHLTRIDPVRILDDIGVEPVDLRPEKRVAEISLAMSQSVSPRLTVCVLGSGARRLLAGKSLRTSGRDRNRGSSGARIKRPRCRLRTARTSINRLRRVRGIQLQPRWRTAPASAFGRLDESFETRETGGREAGNAAPG